jgi:hypothetical protein
MSVEATGYALVFKFLACSAEPRYCDWEVLLKKEARGCSRVNQLGIELEGNLFDVRISGGDACMESGGED